MATETQSTQVELDAPQMLRRLLDLIRTSKTVSDFTPKRLEEAFGSPLIFEEGKYAGYGFGRELNPQWGVRVWLDKSYPAVGGGPRFELAFSPDPSDSSAPMTSICQLDFDEFTAALEAMGFTREPVYDSPPQPMLGQPRLRHGRLMYDTFASSSQPGLGVEVYSRGEANEPIEKTRHACVEQVVVY